MNNTFSTQRLARYAKSDLTANKRLYMIVFGGVISIFMIIYYINYLNMPSSIITDAETEYLSRNLILPEQLSIFLSIFFVLINASISFRNYLNKGLASGIIMLPISKIEKFTYIYILNIVIIPLVLLTVFLIINCGWRLSLGVDLGNEWWFSINKYRLQEVLFIVMIMSIYLWGAIRFRRYQFVIVTLLFICFLVMSIIILSYVDINSTSVILLSIPEKYNYFISVGVCIFLTILFTALAWRRFSRFQIIK